MINPYLLAGAVGVGFFASKKLWARGKEFFTPKLKGTFTVTEFRRKVGPLREQYAGNEEVLSLLDTVEQLCENMKEDDEITIG